MGLVRSECFGISQAECDERLFLNIFLWHGMYGLIIDGRQNLSSHHGNFLKI